MVHGLLVTMQLAAGGCLGRHQLTVGAAVSQPATDPIAGHSAVGPPGGRPPERERYTD